MRVFTRRRLVAVVVLCLLVAGLWTADQVVRRTVQRQAAVALAPHLGGAVPQARLEAFSALYGLATDDWGRVQLVAPDAELAIRGEKLRADIDVRADVVTGLREGRVRAGALHGTARADWEQVSRLSGAQLGGSSDGLVTVTAQVDALDEQLPVVVRGKPFIAADSQRLELLEPRATLDGVEVPESVLTGLLPKVLGKVVLPHYPGVRFTTLQAGASGPAVGFEGSGVELPR